MPRTAFVHEWLTSLAGSEKVLDAALGLYPEAPVFTLVHDPRGLGDCEIARRPVHTSFIQRLPLARRRFRAYLPLFPLAIEQLDLSEFELVVSSSHAVAKGVLTRADQLHVSYVHTPMRYAWDLHHDYVRGRRGPAGLLARAALHYLRIWDRLAADRVDLFVANSQTVARRIARTYRRPAVVVPPPVDVSRFGASRRPGERYLTVGRLVPYKRVDLLVAACNRLKLPLTVIGDGPERARLRRLAGPTVELRGPADDAAVAEAMAGCRAFVFAALEDFGITPVEAMAAGAPVIAYGGGGAGETVVDGRTGLLADAQTVDSLCAALTRFEEAPGAIAEADCRARAAEFSHDRFVRRFGALLASAWDRHASGLDVESLTEESAG